MSLRVTTGGESVEVDAVAGRALDEVLFAAGVLLNRRCGRDGACGGCEVLLEQGYFSVDGVAVVAQTTAPRRVLSCRTTLVGADAAVHVPVRSLIESAAAIDDVYGLGTIRHDPAARRVRLELPKPRAADPRSDVERLVDEVHRATGIRVVEVTLSATRQLSRLLESRCRDLALTLSVRVGGWMLVEVVAGERCTPAFGIALDIGTTTVIGLLVDLESGRVLGKASRYNQQITLAADVASRISAARTDAQVKRLQRLVVSETVNPIIDELCAHQDLAPDAILRVAVAANTVMTHLLLGLHVGSIGKLPFNPTVRAPALVAAALLGLRGNSQACVDVVPAIAGYIGGDITADLLAADIDARADGTLLIDIGTNAEMVLKHGGELLCCATPAGPAFEGAGLRDGCRAAPGAIARIQVGPGLRFELGVIGGGKPNGVCGSAVIDFIAEGYRGGWIDAAGRLAVARLQRHGRHARVAVDGGTSHACVLFEAGGHEGLRDIVVTEADIAEILQAKAALAAGLRTLLEICARTPDSLPRIVLAGGFARQIDLENAMTIGLLPRLPPERFEVIGNGALAGACQALIDRGTLAAMDRLHRRPRVIELNRVPSFEGHFIDSLRLPELPLRQTGMTGPQGVCSR